jgi:LysM repeat protein
MKLKSITGLLALSLTTPAFADVTVDITGATAFRAAALDTIKARYVASGAAFQFAHDSASGAFNGSTRAIFKGTFPGVSGVTTIRTSFSGSVEGIKALVDSPASDPTYYTDIPGNLVTAAAVGGGETHTTTVGFAKTTASSQSEIAFSDVSKNSTPFASASLQPSSATCGVVVFTMLTNEGSPITNVTAQQFRALAAAGFQPLSMFTGNASDTTNVFLTGRNDGSGTRTTYMAETGVGITTEIKQYITVDSSSTALEAIQLVPAGGVNDSDAITAGIQLPTGSDIKAYVDGGQTVTQLVANASTVWSQDTAGNGGYSSGSTLRTDMGKTGTSGVTVFDSAGANAFGETVRADLVTWLSLNDAVTARGNGAILCAYNGVKLDGIAASGSTMSVADKAKVTNGLYTAWGYQQMYRRGDITTGDAVTVYNGIKTNIASNLAAAGIATTDMAVVRSFDGGTVAP